MIRQLDTPTPSWIVEDVDWRQLGRITHAVGFGFLIHATPMSPLRGVDFGPHDTLKEAVQAIGARLKATCVVENEGS